MAFILLFIVTALAFPVSLEIYKHGRENVVSRSISDVNKLIHESILGSVFENIATATTTAKKSAAGTLRYIAFAIIALAFVLLAIKIFFLALSFLLGWLVS